jgi:hypothetical protein
MVLDAVVLRLSPFDFALNTAARFMLKILFPSRQSFQVLQRLSQFSSKMGFARRFGNFLVHNFDFDLNKRLNAKE